MEETDVDPYWRLRPAGPTPADEICRCPSVAAVMLRDSLSENPLHCMACRRELPPERVGFDARFAEEIAHWLSTHRALYWLWLHSGEYETWAAARLADPKGQVNLQGREIVARLNGIIPSYFWWFIDTEIAESERPDVCPTCSGPLDDSMAMGFRGCAACRVIA